MAISMPDPLSIRTLITQKTGNNYLLRRGGGTWVGGPKGGRTHIFSHKKYEHTVAVVLNAPNTTPQQRFPEIKIDTSTVKIQRNSLLVHVERNGSCAIVVHV